MLEDVDLDAAVAEGIVSSAQAAALREISERRERKRAISQGHEERFRFMSGFNDFFFAVGVALFVGGITYFAGRSAIGLAAVALVTWALAELLVGRLKLVLPGILLAACFAAFTFWTFGAIAAGEYWAAAPPPPPRGVSGPGAIGPRYTSFLDHMRAMAGGPLWLAGGLFSAGLAGGAFFLRFRLLFALLLLAGGLVGATVSASALVVPAAAPWLGEAIVLVCGLAVFAAAMLFDVSDRERVTRRADCAFWLHLLAAPLIVHSLIALATGGVSNMTGADAATIVLIFVALAVVAIVIDRRALLVSGLSYLGIVIGSYSAGLAGRGSGQIAAALVILGTLVLALGVGWMPLRRRVMSLLSPFVANRLPPVPARP